MNASIKSVNQLWLSLYVYVCMCVSIYIPVCMFMHVHLCVFGIKDNVHKINKAASVLYCDKELCWSLGECSDGSTSWDTEHAAPLVWKSRVCLAAPRHPKPHRNKMVFCLYCRHCKCRTSHCYLNIWRPLSFFQTVVDNHSHNTAPPECLKCKVHSF